MEIKDRRTPSAGTVAKKHGISMSRLGKQLAIGAKIEREHTHSAAKAREIARDHLAEIPDYYSRLKKMEREAGVKEAYVDPLEAMHNATRARILQGAKEGKYWLLRSESINEGLLKKVKGFFTRLSQEPRVYDYGPQVPYTPYGPTHSRKSPNKRKEAKMRKLQTEERAELIRRILETTTTAAIGGYSKPLGVDSRDVAMGGRNQWVKKELKFAVSRLRNKSVSAPSP